MKSLLIPVLLLTLAVIAPGQILVNEIYTADPDDALEIINVGQSTVSLTGWRVEYGGLNPSLLWTPGTFFFPAGASIAPNQLIVIGESPGSPPTAPGTTTFTTTSNINWAITGPGQTRGGACIIVNASNQGVDMVRWLGAVPPNSFGAVFNGSYTPNTIAFGRVDFTDDDDASDWGDDSLNMGSLSTAQQSLFDVLDLSLTTTGAGDLAWSVVSSNPPVPGGEIYNLVSLQDLTPDGSGILFGIGFDAVVLFGQPASPGNPFHTFLDAQGQWSLNIAAGLPAGLHVESVSILLGANSIARISNVAVATF